MMEIKDFLSEHGYPVRVSGDYLQIPALWRGGSDPTSCAVYPQTGIVVDFVTGEKFNIETLLCKVLGLKDPKELLKHSGNDLPVVIPIGIKIDYPKFFPLGWVDTLMQDHAYFVGRGISESTLRLFRGGVCNEGRLKGRYCFPVYDSKGRLVGECGRSIDGKEPKYKILGNKKAFVWPAWLNLKEILDRKTVVLVESPACILRLWDCGIRTGICLFGVELLNAILNFCIKVAPDRIFVATNNENSGIGNVASLRIAKRLRKFFDGDMVKITLPPRKDFAECSIHEIEVWKQKQGI